MVHGTIPPMRKVLILGATSAIATEVAVLYARQGHRLHLVGRDPVKLAATVHRCAPSVVTHAIADFDQLATAEGVVAHAMEALGGMDTVLIAHGALGDQRATEESMVEAEAVLRTNFVSVVSLLIPLANRMEARGQGHIGVITSVAGDRGRPRNYTYGAAKGALHVYLQGLRTRLYPAGVTVTTLKLGPVDTPMTRTHTKHRLFGKVPAVARDIVRAVEAGGSEVYIPGYWRYIMQVVRRTPEGVVQRLGFLSGR